LQNRALAPKSTQKSKRHHRCSFSSRLPNSPSALSFWKVIISVFSAGGKKILEPQRHQVRKDYFSIFPSRILKLDLCVLCASVRYPSIPSHPSLPALLTSDLCPQISDLYPFILCALASLRETPFFPIQSSLIIISTPFSDLRPQNSDLRFLSLFCPPSSDIRPLHSDLRPPTSDLCPLRLLCLFAASSNLFCHVIYATTTFKATPHYEAPGRPANLPPKVSSWPPKAYQPFAFPVHQGHPSPV